MKIYELDQSFKNMNGKNNGLKQKKDYELIMLLPIQLNNHQSKYKLLTNFSVMFTFFALVAPYYFFGYIQNTQKNQ